MVRRSSNASVRRVAFIALTVALTMTAAACSRDGTSTSGMSVAPGTAATVSTTPDSVTTASVAPSPVRCSPALLATLDGTDGKPLVCAAARFLSTEEEADPAGDYVLLTVSWAFVDAELSVAVTSSSPTLDNVFVTGTLANNDEVTQCSAVPNAGDGAVFVTTAPSGRCMVRQKVEQGASGVDLSLDVTVPAGSRMAATVHATPGQ